MKKLIALFAIGIICISTYKLTYPVWTDDDLSELRQDLRVWDFAISSNKKSLQNLNQWIRKQESTPPKSGVFRYCDGSTKAWKNAPFKLDKSTDGRPQLERTIERQERERDELKSRIERLEKWRRRKGNP